MKIGYTIENTPDREWFEVNAIVDNVEIAYLHFGVYGDTAIISDILVHESTNRRKGVASAMLEYAEMHSGFILQHSDDRSSDGVAWSATTGRHCPINKAYDRVK